MQGDVGVSCPCGGRFLEKVPGGFPREIECARCGKSPLDLVTKSARNDATPQVHCEDCK